MRRTTFICLCLLVIGGLSTSGLISWAEDRSTDKTAAKPHAIKLKARPSGASRRLSTKQTSPVDSQPAQTTDSAKAAEPAGSVSAASEPDDGKLAVRGNPKAISILHLGDSHVSADYFTGEIRRRLQSQYGYGGVGYVTAGHPHSGVRSSVLKVDVSSGWTYKSLQRPDALVESFWLSGYNALANQPDETLTFSSERPIAFDLIEIEAMSQPGGGAIEISINGTVIKREDLSADSIEPKLISLPIQAPGSPLKELSIRTMNRGRVLVSGINVYNRRGGLTYNSVGYVGATVSILNKFNEKIFADDLSRINPDVVILSFGTNEAANDELDIAQYKMTYERAIERVHKSLPSAVIVMILPPDFNEIPSTCKKETIAKAPCRAGAADSSSPDDINIVWRVATPSNLSTVKSEANCVWRTPAKLEQVRDAQREIAERHHFTYWDWEGLMPKVCGAHQWFGMTPPLMSRDHIHMTTEGYRRSAEQFLLTMAPIIGDLKSGSGAVSSK
jgi:lysophospholipase L1-like esterase